MLRPHSDQLLWFVGTDLRVIHELLEVALVACPCVWRWRSMQPTIEHFNHHGSKLTSWRGITIERRHMSIMLD
jgi:hypothetical protein